MSTAGPRDIIAHALCRDNNEGICLEDCMGIDAPYCVAMKVQAENADAILSALTAAGYRVVREGELDAARQALIQQRAFIRHWIDDVNGGLKPTVGSLRAASDMVDAALRALVGEAK